MCVLAVLAMVAAAPNVVVLSCDTLRPDHLGCYAYSENTSPALDQLARRSLVFDDAICEVPLTNPSFISMMTSRVPRMTGATRNGLRLPANTPTLAEQFQRAGYDTWCVQSNWTLKARLSGLERGFNVYEDNFHTKRWGVIKSERYADEVARIALDMLKKRDANRPFFAWIHFSDPHAPYRFHEGLNPAGKSRWRMSPQDRTRALYDSEVAYMDSYAGRILDALPKDNTFVIFVADHSESLYEHQYLGHGRRLYQAGIRIPLMISGPGISAGRSAAPARGLDVAPTILALAGLGPIPGALGLDLVHASVPQGRPRVIETYGGAVPRLPGARALMAGSAPQRQSVLADGWKLILTGPKAELFDLRADPDERTNVANRNAGKLAELSALIHQWNERIPRGHARDPGLTKDDVSALESLGYL